MGIERVDYYSDEEYEQALQAEAEQACQWEAQFQEPDVVPCYECGEPMYQEGGWAEDNICDACKALKDEA